MGPRRDKEGRVRIATRELKQWTPSQGWMVEHGLSPIQVDKSAEWESVWRRKVVSGTASFVDVVKGRSVRVSMRSEMVVVFAME